MQTERQEDAIRMVIGILVAILIHLLILLLFMVSNKIIKLPSAKSAQKISLDLSNFVPPPAPAPKPMIKHAPPKLAKPVIKHEKVLKPISQPKQKVVEKDKALIAKKDISENNITKKKKLQKKKVEKKIKAKREKPKKKMEKKRVKKSLPKMSHKMASHKKREPRRSSRNIHNSRNHSTSLASSLMGSSKARFVQTTSSRRYSRKKVSSATRKIIKRLYGSEFDGYGEAQKKFIENNLALIHRITQATLSRNGYPEVAARTGQQGVNIVSFYLHPNGNISNLRLEVGMGYEILDQNTLNVIRLAYKDYPLPLKKTKIKFYVEYTIDGY